MNSKEPLQIELIDARDCSGKENQRNVNQCQLVQVVVPKPSNS